MRSSNFPTNNALCYTLSRSTAGVSSLSKAFRIIISSSFVYCRSPVEGRLSGGAPLHFLSASGVMPHTLPVISLSLPKQRNSGFPHPVQQALVSD